MEITERFWSKVNKDGPVPLHRPELGPCFEWTACIQKSGYGRFGEGRKFVWQAHRWIWQHTYGLLDEGACVLHHCDNRRCVRPSHLFLGTYGDNHADMVAKGRAVYIRGERHGRAKLTDEQVAEIRRLRAVGIGVVELGCRFGIDASQVSRIANRVSRS